MKWPPTDLEIIEEIYSRYYDQFASFSKDSANRGTKIYVPIDIESIANHFGIDGDILFGRLYYYLEPKYGFKQPDGTKVPFFSLRVEQDLHVVNYPLLASVLAELRAGRKKHLIATWLSAVAIVIALFSAAIALIGDDGSHSADTPWTHLCGAGIDSPSRPCRGSIGVSASEGGGYG